MWIRAGGNLFNSEKINTITVSWSSGGSGDFVDVLAGFAGYNQYDKLVSNVPTAVGAKIVNHIQSCMEFGEKLCNVDEFMMLNLPEKTERRNEN